MYERCQKQTCGLEMNGEVHPLILLNDKLCFMLI